MSEWKEYKLGELVTIVNGFAFKSNDFLDSGGDDTLPVVKIKNVANGDVHLNDVKYYSVSEDLSKFIVSNGEILMALTGNHPELETQVVGLTSRYKLNQKAYVNQRVAKIESKNKAKMLDNYLYYFLKDNNTHQYLASQSSGSANQANISKSDIENTPIELPGIDTQRNISEALKSLDDKIDLLQRQNTTLDELAETLFRQWFVEGAEESWEVVKVSDVAKINSKTISKNFPYSEIEYLDTGSITNGVISNFQTVLLADAPSRAQRIVENNDIVYSLVRPIQRHFGLLNGIANNTVASTGFCVISCKNFSPHFLYILLTKEESVEYFDMIAEASTSTYPSLKPSDIANFEFQKPPENKLIAFSEIASDSWGKINANYKQIRTLTLLRDTLLPKLMSREIQILN